MAVEGSQGASAGKQVVFVSYSHVDRIVVENLCEELDKHFEVWWDARELDSASTWWDQVRDILKTRGGVVVLVLSASSLGKAGRVGAGRFERPPTTPSGSTSTQEQADEPPMVEEVQFAVDEGIPIVPVAIDWSFEITLERREEGGTGGEVFPGLKGKTSVRPWGGPGGLGGKDAARRSSMERTSQDAHTLPIPGCRWNGLVEEIRSILAPHPWPTTRAWALVDYAGPGLLVVEEGTATPAVRAEPLELARLSEGTHTVKVSGGAPGEHVITGLGPDTRLSEGNEANWRELSHINLRSGERVVTAVRSERFPGTIDMIISGCGTRTGHWSHIDGMMGGRYITSDNVRAAAVLASVSDLVLIYEGGRPDFKGNSAKTLERVLTVDASDKWVQIVSSRNEASLVVAVLWQFGNKQALQLARLTRGQWTVGPRRGLESPQVDSLGLCFPLGSPESPAVLAMRRARATQEFSRLDSGRR